MIKKKDLTKQFELVVQQEIKNHNAAIEQSNSLLESFRQELESLKKSHSHTLSCNECDHKTFSSRLSELEAKFNNFVAETHARHNYATRFSESLMSRLDTLDRSMQRILQEQQDLQSDISYIKKCGKEQDDYIANRTAEYNRLLRDFYEKLSIKSKIIEEDIEQKISHFSSLEGDYNHQIYFLKQDLDGIKKKVDLFYQETFPLQKKIEFLLKIHNISHEGKKP